MIDINKLRDHKFYLENFTKIKTKEGGLHPFILNNAQLDLFNTINKSNRVMILKARQLGMSTGVSGYFYVDAITTPGINVALIAYNADLTTELLDKIKTFHATTPVEIRPRVKYNSKYEMTFPTLDSKILVLPSSVNVGSGYTLHRCLLSELSKIDKAEEKMSSLLPAIPFSGKLVIESSPAGVGNLYHKMWMDGNSEYIKKKYGWWWGYSEEEIKKIKKQINNDMIFAQEYEMEFLASGRCVFNKDVLKELRKNILEIGDRNIYIDSNGNEKEHIVYQNNDGWIIYQEPEAGEIYVSGNDVAEGVDGGDNSCSVIFNKKTGEEVAFYNGLISPDMFASKLNKMGRHYNNALMVVEVNNHGLVTLTTLKNLIYPNLYFRPARFETMATTYTDRLGWRTTKVTRILLIEELNNAIRDRELKIHSGQILNEMLTFIYDDNNNMKPSSRICHDDSIFATGIAYQGFKVLFSGSLSQIDESEFLPKSFSY